MEYSYDETENVTEYKDHTGIVTYQYDQYQRLTGTMDTRGNWLSYSYDETGRLKTFDNGFGATTYEYDLLDRVTRVIDHNGNPPYTNTMP